MYLGVLIRCLEVDLFDISSFLEDLISLAKGSEMLKNLDF